MKALLVALGLCVPATACGREARIARPSHEARIDSLVGALKDPLLSQLRDLLQRGQTIEAITQYRAATGQDLTTAHDVVHALRDARQ